VDDAVELSDMIWQLRHDLARAMYAGANAAIKFRADSVELELTVAVERSRDPGIKVKFWVIDANAGAKRAATTTQTIRLTLHPVNADAPTEAALVDGDALPGEI
jgi:hypothetical protein